jgi:large subunit ribosomal protein L3
MIKKIPVQKVGMSTFMDEGGLATPVTLVKPFAVTVTEIRRPEKNGYSAVQLAYGETLQKRVNKPKMGVLKKAGTDKVLRSFYESRQDAADFADITLGQEINPADAFTNWGTVQVTGISKGKGFAGAVKRWGFAGQQRTHGDPDNRRSMSNGATDPARVFPGQRRAGHMGAEKVSVSGIQVKAYNADLNLLALKGSIPGPNGGVLYVTLQSEKKG